MTPQERKVMELARTALGVQLDALLGKAGHLHNDDRRRYAEEGIKAIDEALAQPKEPEQEPVGTYGGIYQAMRKLLQSGKISDQQVYQAMCDKPLYTSPPQPKEPAPVIQKSCEQCAHQYHYGQMTGPCGPCRFYSNFALAPQPAQRKPLTRGQIREIEVDVSLNPSFDYITPAEQLCRAIEAAHGIKE